VEIPGTGAFASDYREVNVFRRLQASMGIFYSYVDQKSPNTFADTSETSLITAATYRLAAYTNNAQYIPNAEKAYALILKSIDSRGWLQNTVDPEIFSTPSKAGSGSPEEQSFKLMLKAARYAYYAATTAHSLY
jgi:rhamnogalacturonyl hydrolase YesR